MGLIPKMPVGEPETHDAVCDVPREAAARLGRDLVMMAVGAVLSRAVDAAISMLP